MLQEILLEKVISGGQTGADTAGLDWAIKNEIVHGGWCPKGRKSESGRIDQKYLLTFVEAGVTTAVLATDFLDWHARFGLPQKSNGLLFAVFAYSHVHHSPG